ncbi:MAG: hypothetical protein Q4D74_06560, partial [Comamonadaceae bacterium]|nr:hypothetical protein [Comamonadaceae bacterium]
MSPGQMLTEMARTPAAPATLSPLAQKSQATDRAVQSVGQAQKTLEEVSAASLGRSAALPHLQNSVQQAQADLRTAVQNEVDTHLALKLLPGQRPTAADYAKAMDAVTQRHQGMPDNMQLLQQAAPRHVAGAHTPAAVPDKRQSNSQADPTTPEGFQERYPDEMEGRSQQERQEAADAARQLRDGAPEEQAQALVTLEKYLPDQKMDDLTQHLGVAEQPTVQSLRRDAKAKEQIAKLADPDTPPAERADAALALAGRMQELNLLPGKVGTFVEKYVKDLPSVKNVVSSLNTLSDPNASVADKAAAALGLAKDLGSALPGKLGDTLKPFLDKLPDAKKAIEALNTLSKPDASPADKVKAGLDLASGLGNLAPEKLKEALKPYLSMLPAGTKLVDAITTWAKPDASPLEKAKAALALANAAKDSLGKAFPELAEHLRYADSTLKSVGYALTLLDPNASFKDKAEAALGLTAEVPQIAGDLEKLKSFLKENGIRASDAAQIAEEVKKLPAVNQLPEELRGKLDPEVARQLTPEQAQRLAKLHASGDDKALQEALGKALSGLKDPASVNALLDAAEGVQDKAARQGLLEALGGLKPGMADELLAGTLNGKPAAQALSDLFGKMDGDSAKKLAGMLADVDANTLRRALELGDMVDGK